MKKIIIIFLLSMPFLINAQEIEGTKDVKNLKVHGKIRTSSETLNTSPDLILTQDTANDLTTQTGTQEFDIISMSSLADSLSKEQFDSLNTVKIIIADSSAIGMSSDGGVLATTETVLGYINDSASYIFQDGITESSGVVSLGGTMTTNKRFTITGTNGSTKQTVMTFGDDELGSYIGDFEVSAVNDGAVNKLKLGLGSALLISTDASNDNQSISVSAVNNMKITDEINLAGIEYAADYSANSNARTLTDSSQVSAMIADNLSSGFMQVAKAEILYTNTTQTTIITLPTNAVVWEIQVNVTTSFNDSGADDLDIGITGNSSYYGTLSLDVPTPLTGWANISGNTPDEIGSSTNITFQYTGQNTDATQGVAEVFVHYSKH